MTGHIGTLVHGDFVEAVIEFESGAIATIQASTTSNPGLGAQLWVSDGPGRTADVAEFPESVGFTGVWSIRREEEFTPLHRAGGTFDIPLADIHTHLVPFRRLQIEDFINAIREGQEPLVTGRNAVKSLEIILAIYESSQSGHAVDLSRQRAE